MQQINNVCKQALSVELSIVSKLVAAQSVIFPAPMYVHQLQLQLIQALKSITLILDSDNLEQGVPEGTSMVDTQSPQLERKKHPTDIAQLSNTI